MRKLDIAALILVIVGALNWGLVAVRFSTIMGRSRDAQPMHA